ncbi:MAG TPA: SBBP repeat-containing protein, partial [Candidatus Krumholzibacteria bacterium]|nr:SBBP repeat-containing protein [Candidatus Krumholzibacteria bacterium]
MRTILGLALALFVVALATPSLAQAPEHLWSEGFGGFNNDFGNAIAVDAAGNVVVVGGFSQAVSFGGPTLVSDSGSEDIFMAKYDANGAHLWSKRFGGPGSDVASGVAVDGSGNIFVTGSFHGAVNFGGGNVVSPGGNASMFLAKYDANGAHQWSEGFGGAGDPNSGAVGNAIALDGSGNVVVAGTFAGTVNLGGGNVVGAGNFDMFLAKYDANGAHQWSHGFGGVGFDWGLGVAVDGSGNVVATGNFEGTVNFGGGNLVSAGGYDMFLAKYDPNGVHVWSRRFGGSGGDQGSGVAVDGSGNVVVTGAFEGTANFGGANLVSAGSGDIFLAKYTANGVHQWSERFGGVGSDGGNAVAVDGSGNVVVTGAFAASVYFGGNLGWSSAGAEDMFIARFSAGGAYQYSRAGGGTSDDYGEAVAVDGSGKAVATGSYSGAADFGGASLAGSGGNDIFIVKYGSEPLLLQIKDLPLDQGGVLKVFFSASSHDG